MIFLFFLLIITNNVSNSQSRIDTLINQINFETKYPSHSIFEIYQYGKESIPFLIQRIGDTTIIFNELIIPTSSYIPNYKMPSGIFFAYLIELILAKDSLKSRGDSPFLLGDYQNYVYHDGIIYRKRDDKFAYITDLIQLKVEYQKWWELNKDKSLDDLRSNYKNNKKPLDSTDFIWR